MTITRRGLADEIDRLDDQLAEIQVDKAEVFKAYRSQLEKDGMAKPEIAVEVTAMKAAIRRRRAMEDDPRAVENKDALIDAIYVEISGASQRGTVSATRARAPRASGEGNGSAAPPASSAPPQTTPAPAAAASELVPDRHELDTKLSLVAEESEAEGRQSQSLQMDAVTGITAASPPVIWRTPLLIEIDLAEFPTFLLRGHPDCVVGRGHGPPDVRPP